MMLGAGVEFFHVDVPASIAGKSLEDSGIGERCGLNVIAVQRDGTLVPNPPRSLLLPADGELLMIGSHDQTQEFMRVFH
jgi:Trk K+ transport system NAD-binding subunit